MNACSGIYAAALAGRMADGGEEYEARLDALTDETFRDPKELTEVLWDAFSTEDVADLIDATVRWHAAPLSKDGDARASVLMALAKLVERAVDERVKDKLRSEGWAA